MCVCVMKKLCSKNVCGYSVICVYAFFFSSHFFLQVPSNPCRAEIVPGASVIVVPNGSSFRIYNNSTPIDPDTLQMLRRLWAPTRELVMAEVLGMREDRVVLIADFSC